jgi:hypothetical protein
VFLLFDALPLCWNWRLESRQNPQAEKPALLPAWLRFFFASTRFLGKLLYF